MARIQFTGLVESIRGSIKGTTFQRNAYGFTAKAKPNMVNPNRIAQQQRKFVFADQARKWRSLTETNRAQWQAYAEAFPLPARLNPASELNGFNYFSKYHNFLNQGGINSTLANPGNTQHGFNIDQIELILGGGALTVEVASVLAPADMRVMVYASPVVPFGQEWVKVTPRFMASGVISDEDGSWSVNIAAAFIAQWGALPALGDWIGLKLVYLAEDTAQMVEQTTQQYEVIA